MKKYNILLVMALVLFIGAISIACYCMVASNPRPTGGCVAPTEEIDTWAKHHHQYQLDIEGGVDGKKDVYILWDATGGHRIGQCNITWKSNLDKLVLKDNQ